VLLAAACYGFAGGGLPPAIRTVAVLPFDNLTAEPALTQQVNLAVREAVESRLGLRAAAESFQILGEVNLADPNPGPFIKLWLYDHPPVAERVAFAASYDPWSKGEAPRYVRDPNAP